MVVSNDLVKQLRQLTGTSITLCKKTLEETNGDMDRAMSLLKKSSEALAAKKGGRVTGSGLVEAYVHGNRRVGVLVELRCETDFVARNPEFQALAHDIALHIAGANPMYVDEAAIPDVAKEEARRLFTEEAGLLGKDPAMTEKIVEGKMIAHFRDSSLLSQMFLKDPSITISELIKRSIGHFGENIAVEKFSRFSL
jgi:elongation factor Ts